ncbi:hypothetical protein LTR27_012500 [Elasticomyces elasticus]|nr:hypothetical protein LTR27_012500 [Elasticomyces elasticus]
MSFFHRLSRKKTPSQSPIPEASSSNLAQNGNETEAPRSAHDKLGLFRLAGPSDEDADVDIVAVHGLLDNPFDAWQRDGKIWLQDPEFLPSLVPSARILSYGYNSSVALSQTFSGVDEFAELLLNSLEQERDACKGRPIVFICHSLGGIVVKKALIVAHNRSPSYYKDILDSVQGIVFMGVPHAGAGIARLGALFSKLLQMATAGRTTNSDLVSFLKKGSKPLSDISGQAIHRLSALQVYSFYELETYYGEVIVNKDSALLSLPNEKTFPMNANHSTVCKFGSENSKNYLLVGRAIAGMVENIKVLNELKKMPKFSDVASALHWAVGKGKIGIVKELMGQCAAAHPGNPGAYIDHVNAEGDSLLTTAVRLKHTIVAAHLILAGADMEVENLTREGLRPIHVAAEVGDAQIIALLIKRQEQREIRSGLGLTPLMHAVMKGNFATSKALIESGVAIEAMLIKGQRTAAVPGIDFERAVNTRSTALMMAALSGHMDVTWLLLDYRANMEATTDGNETPLTAASYYDHVQVVQHLLVRGANKEAKNKGGFTALIYAANQDHPEVIRTLLDHGALIDSKKGHGMTALMEAIYYQREYSAQLLVERGASLSETADHILSMLKPTPLHIAAQRGNTQIIQMLVSHGADLLAKTANGHSPLDIARSRKHTAATRLLEQLDQARASQLDGI